MKHGHKKGKAKATPSGKKSSKAAKKSKTSQSAHGKKGSAKAAAPTGKSNGKGRSRSASEAVAFHNPIVGTAFKRAIKKYPTAFRRLTD